MEPPPRATMMTSGRGMGPPGLHGVEAAYAGFDFGGGFLALHQRGPDDDVDGEAVADAVEDVADDGAGRAGDDADDGGEEGDRLLALGVEETFGGELLLALFQELHQGADAGGAHLVGDQLVVGAAGIGGQAAFGDDFEAFLRLERQAAGVALPHDGVERRAFVLDVEIHVAGLGEDHPAQLSAHADEGVVFLDRLLERIGQLGDGHLRGV